MIKLSKTQARAIINRLGREASNLRNKLVEEEKKNYIPSAKATKLIKLIAKRDKLRDEFNRTAEEAEKLARDLGVTGYYTYTTAEEVLTKLRDSEFAIKYPMVDLYAAFDDLIIESIKDEFDVDNFIESYLKQLRNGR